MVSMILREKPACICAVIWNLVLRARCSGPLFEPACDAEWPFPLFLGTGLGVVIVSCSVEPGKSFAISVESGQLPSRPYSFRLAVCSIVFQRSDQTIPDCDRCALTMDVAAPRCFQRSNTCAAFLCFGREYRGVSRWMPGSMMDIISQDILNAIAKGALVIEVMVHPCRRQCSHPIANSMGPSIRILYGAAYVESIFQLSRRWIDWCQAVINEIP